MCIIVYKPAGKHFPSWETLKTCFENNHDGAGFMYLENDKVKIRKGFMSYKAFKKALHPLIEENYDKPFIMHFRISTHGGVKPELTQPFPLSENSEILKALSSSSDVGIAHNGVIPMTAYASNLSDTALFIKKYASYLIKDYTYYKDTRLLDILEELSGSRLCILSKDGHVERLGTGWVEDNGIFYSNSSYEKYRSKYSFDLSKYFGKPKEKEDTSKAEAFDPMECTGNYDDCCICPNQVDCWGGFLEEDNDELICKVNELGQAACYGCPNEKICYYL